MNSSGASGEVAAMWATWVTPPSRGGSSAAAAAFEHCTIHINLAVWPNRQVDDSDFPVFCKEMVHEWGHFEGRPDRGAKRGTVEYERPELARVPACERYRLIYGSTIYTPTARLHFASRRSR